MPILKFYTSTGQLTDEEKQELAATLTAGYERSMPAFFVNVVFHELPHGSFFMAGKPTDGKFVRLTAEHIAVNWKDDLERAYKYLDWVGQVFQEKFEPRGWTWEFSVTESRKELWRIQSLIPPEVGSEPMQRWMEAGKALPWEGGKL